MQYSHDCHAVESQREEAVKTWNDLTTLLWSFSLILQMAVFIYANFFFFSTNIRGCFILCHRYKQSNFQKSFFFTSRAVQLVSYSSSVNHVVNYIAKCIFRFSLKKQ